MKIFNFLKDIIAPKKCYSCLKEGHFLCQECYKKLHNYDEVCYMCKCYSENYKVHKKCQKGVYFDNILVLTHYKNRVIKKLIIDSKFYGKKDILEDFSLYLGELFVNHILEEYWVFNKDDFIIIPPPLYFLKKLTRGYNQTEILAHHISKITGINHNKNIIKKYKNTKQQSNLSKKERLLNLDNVFKINKKSYKEIENKTIIIIDDVISTGTTLNTISKILKKYGAKKIIGLCIASD